MHNLGLQLPSPAYVFAMVFFSVVGWVAWRHGKRTARPAVKWLGVALMFYGYATPQTWLLYAVGCGLSACVYYAWSR